MTNEDLKRFYPDNQEINEAHDFVRLDENGQVPAGNLPSYVDDIIEGYYYNEKFYEDSAHTKEIKGEKGKIYLDLLTHCTYRWGGTAFALIYDPSTYIKKVEVTNIQEISSSILSSLNCGDMVIKNTSGSKHTYIVSYKQDDVGICLTYSDATVVETVSYDYVTDTWVYNSTDIGHLTPEE